MEVRERIKFGNPYLKDIRRRREDQMFETEQQEDQVDVDWWPHDCCFSQR